MDAIQIAIHAAIVDTTILDEEIIKHRANLALAKNFHQKDWFTPIRKVWYYFSEKETRERYQQTERAKFASENNKNIFFHPERTAFAYRSNIAFHYSIGKKATGKKSQTFTDDQLNNLANDYILGQGVFSNKSDDEAKQLFMEMFQQFSSNNGAYKTFVKKSCKQCNISSDLLLQLQSYRANIAITRKLLTGAIPQAQKDIDSFIMRYQQIPLALRLLGVEKIDQEVENSLATPATKEKLTQLMSNIYQLTVHIIPPTTSFWSFDLQKSPYSSFVTRCGLAWKWLPWWVKILVIAGVVASAAFLGGWTLLVLPLFILLKQFCKTKADYLHSIQHYIGRFASHNTLEKAQKETVLQNVGKLGKKAKDTRMIYTSLQPELLENPVLASTLAKNIIRSVVNQQTEAIKTNVDLTLAHLHFQKEKQVPTFAVQRQEQKEQTILYLYKSVILWATLLGYDIINQDNNQEIVNSSTFKKFIKDYSATLATSRKAYHRHANSYARRDGIMSWVITWFTWWIWWYLWPTLASTSVAYAAGELFDMTISQENPLYKYLLDNDMDPASHSFTKEEIESILQNNDDIRLEWEEIVYTSDAKNLDIQLVDELQEILTDDQYKQFIQQLQSDNNATLWDTMINIAGKETWNELSHQIVDQIWKADREWSSEIFMKSVENGLPIDDANHEQWDMMISLLHNTYDYDGYESYQEWVQKDRLISTMQELSHNDFAIDDLAGYTTEQRAVLIHASFINIDTTDIKDILLDYSGQEEVIWSIIPVEESKASDIIDESENVNAAQHTPRWNTHHDGTIHAYPVPFGKNTIIDTTHSNTQKKSPAKLSHQATT